MPGTRYYELLEVAADTSYDPIAVLQSDLISMVWAPWEGGLAPDEYAARAQNPSITTGTIATTLTEWTGNSDHFVNDVRFPGVTWTTNRMNGLPAFVCASQSYEQTAKPALDDNMTIVFVYNNSTASTGFLYQGNVASSPQIISRNTGALEWFDVAGNAATTLVANQPHIITRYISATDTIARLDGAQIDIENTVNDYGTDAIGRWLSSNTGSSRLGGDMMGWFVIRNATDGKLAALEQWLSEQAGVVLAGSGYTIDFPSELAVLQNTGNMRAYGTYDSASVFSLDARHNGGAWNGCTLAGGQWSVAFASANITGELEVRVNGSASSQIVENVSLGRVVAGFGQSNMLGSSEFKTNNSANTSIAIYDPRPFPMGLMAGRSNRDTWGPAYDEGWIPEYLANRHTNDAVPWGFMRFAIGSTRISFWEPTAAVDAAGLGYAVQYYAEFRRALIESQGHDPATYDPLTDPACCEEIFIQIGESDARFGTSKAAFKASLSAIAAQLKIDFGPGVLIRVSVLQDLFTTGYVDTLSKLTDIQDAVTETVLADANVSAGPDFSDVILAKAPPEINGNVHFFLPAEVTLAAERWDNYPTT